MTESDRPGCQECGGEVLVEVSWKHWGVDRVYYECQGCGRAGWTEPTPARSSP